MLSASRQAVTGRSPAPEVAEGFEHIQRYWDSARGCWISKILPGEFYVSRSNEYISTVLGSCVCACIIDATQCIGGMNHFMLPESTALDRNAWGGIENATVTRFGVHAMEHLINTILAQGGRRERLRVKLFGGGKINDSMRDIGRKNIQFAERYLETEHLELIGEDLGGIHPRKVLFDPIRGRVWVKKLKAVHDPSLFQRELNLSKTLVDKPIAGEIELF